MFLGTESLAIATYTIDATTLDFCEIFYHTFELRMCQTAVGSSGTGILSVTAFPVLTVKILTLMVYDISPILNHYFFYIREVYPHGSRSPHRKDRIRNFTLFYCH